MSRQQAHKPFACPVCGAEWPHTTPMANEYHESVKRRTREQLAHEEGEPLPEQMVDILKVRRALERIVTHYEVSAPTVSRWADDLYRRTGDDPASIRLVELVAAQMLYSEGSWEQANMAANRIYKLMDRLGQDTTGHAGY